MAAQDRFYCSKVDNYTLQIAKNKGADQTEWMHRLVCTLVVRIQQSGFLMSRPQYCRFRNFRENFIFANSIKRHIRDVKNSQLRQDLPIPINDRWILPFREGFIFRKLRICEVSQK